MTTIRVKNLRLRTFIGFNEAERKNKQDVVINMQLTYDGEEAATSDDISDAFNYRTVTKRVIEHVENNSFLLLERLSEELLALIMEASAIREATVEIDKPHALRFADSVSVEASATRAKKAK